MAAIHLPWFRVFAIIGLLILSGANTATIQPRLPEYRIGPDDVLSISLFDQDPRYSGDVTVRPDGKITLALIDDIDAAGRTPTELKAAVAQAYEKYFKEPVLMVSAKQIRSRKVYILGAVRNPGVYNLNDSMNIVQLIAIAGDLQDWADKKNIVLIRKDPLPDGKLDRIFFDYNSVFKPGSQDRIPNLEPGDQVVVK